MNIETRIEADADWYRILFIRRSRTAFLRARVGDRVGVRAKNVKSVLKALAVQPLQRDEIARQLVHSNVSGAVKRTVNSRP